MASKARKSLKKPFEITVNSKFGAPMGRPQDDVEDFVGLVYLQKVAMKDGDYDDGGAYWGSGGTPLYCAWDDEGHQLFIRAKDSFDAKKQLPAHWKYADKEAKSKNNLYAEVMLQQYMATALWSTNDESDERGGEPLDKNYSTSDLAKETKTKMLADCQKFYGENRELLEDPEFGFPADQAGHYFWLNRNGHGTGFWNADKYGTDESREALSQACAQFGEVNLYVERGKIYQDL